MSTTRTFLLRMSTVAVFVGIIAGLFFGASKTLAATIQWDGGGAADTNWSNAVNWSTDTVPGSGDVALFNASSTTNTLIDVDIQVSGISVESGYIGTITQASAVTTGTNGFTLNGGTFIAGSGTLDINDGFTITGSAIFNASTTPIFVSGNWNNGGGTFNAGTSTTTLDGGNQSIFGNTTFYTLIKNASTTAVTLTFEAGKTQTTLGTLRLTGQPNAYLSLRSSQDGAQYSIDPRGTIVIEYVDLKDANNISAAPIDTREKSVLHSGNNTNWIFGSTVSAPGGTLYIPQPPAEEKPQPKPEEKPVPKKEPEPVKEEKKPVSGVKPVPAVKVVPKPAPPVQVTDRTVEAMAISTGDSGSIRESLQINRNRGAEERALSLIQRVFKGKAQLNQSRQTYALINFIAYGGPSTKHLGSGERAGVADSFVAAYGKMPIDAADWEAVISIANGTRPEKRSPQAEWRAEQSYKAVYGRRADMSKKEERQAVDVMAYGLRTAKRNLEAEQQALVKYRKVYNKLPSLSEEWDIVRAIAYSAITQ